MIYLDFAATTPMSKESLDVYSQAALGYYGNSSSLHDIGTTAKQLLEKCREETARIIAGKKDGVYFTSGGSESNYLAIRSLLKGNEAKGKHIITTQTEHSSIYSLCRNLEREGYDITFLPVDSNGLISLSQLKAAIRSDTCFVSIHHANSETGVIQPIKAIGKILKEENILFHSDCVQTFGKIPIDVEKSHLTSISISAHKIYGPKGIGVLYIDPTVSWKSVYEGTSHERGMRPGTVNLPGVAAFVAAAQSMESSMNEQRNKHEKLRQYFMEQIKKLWLPAVIEGEHTGGLEHIIGLRLEGIEGQHVMLECNRKGIAISTGSACQVGSQAPSRLMLATGKTPDEAREFIRISFGKTTTFEEIEAAIQALKDIADDWIKRSG